MVEMREDRRKLKKPRPGTSFVPAQALFRQADVARALRALKAAGIPADQVEIEIAEGKVTVRPAAINGNRHLSAAATTSGFMSIPEACAYGKFGRSRCYELIGEGALRIIKNGKTTLIEKKSIDQLLRRLAANTRKKFGR